MFALLEWCCVWIWLEMAAGKIQVSSTKFCVLLKARLVSLWVLSILCNSRLAAGSSRYGGRKLAADSPPVEDSVDPESGLPYISDKDLISTGVTGQISPAIADDYRLPYRNLRSFPEGVKNCYTLKPEAGRNNNYLIRARLVYGNYDGKNSTPQFQIYLGVNLWATVTSDDGREEAIYMPTTDYVEVCLVNIGSGVPFISALELRRFDNSIYRTHDQLFMALSNRYDVGSGTIVRYPFDVDDRVWVPYEDGSLKKLQTNASIARSSNDSYELPELMLKTAYGTLNSSTPFVYGWTPYATTFYFCFHFAEIEKLDSGTLREMSIVLNGVHTIAQSVKLEYLKPQTICSSSAGLPVILNQENYLRISAASGSDLPPIINGIEIFYFRNLSDSPTFLQDVSAVMDIKKTFKLLNSDWQGDPCLPEISVWNGLKCSRSDPPRIISLNLSRSNLTGEIPFSLSNLTQLETLDLSYNEFSGSLPEYLAHLPRLKILNVVGNNLGGMVPEGLLVKSRDGVLDLSVTGNPELCLSPPCKQKRNSVVPVIVAVVSAVVLVICLVLLTIHIRKRKKNAIKSNEKISLKQKNREYSYSEVVSITDNFRHPIGEGGFGKVYLGALKDKTQVAVKLLSPTSKQGYKAFQAEAQLLMIVHHRNLVSLVGYCDEGNTKALIYEYMVKGNLQQALSETNTNVLSWNERLQIAVDVAHGLEYLHNGCRPPIIHRDLKPANILLDDKMQAKIADFGLSRTSPTESQSQITTQLAGTRGYLGPETISSGNVAKESDVYSFGTILFELLTAKPAIIKGSEDSIHIVDWAKPLIEDGNTQKIVDPRLEGSIESCSAGKFAELALSCTLPSSAERPDMSDVVSQLLECLKMAQDKTPQIPRNHTDNFSYNSVGSESFLGPR